MNAQLYLCPATTTTHAWNRFAYRLAVGDGKREGLLDLKNNGAERG